jgi:DNA-binding protein HU-beta
MNKNELVAKIAETAGFSKADAVKALNAFIAVTSKSLAKGDQIRLVGFGTFSVSERKATNGRNPRTGNPIKIKASKQAKFKPGKTLKDAVN